MTAHARHQARLFGGATGELRARGDGKGQPTVRNARAMVKTCTGVLIAVTKNIASYAKTSIRKDAGNVPASFDIGVVAQLARFENSDAFEVHIPIADRSEKNLKNKKKKVGLFVRVSRWRLDRYVTDRIW